MNVVRDFQMPGYGYGARNRATASYSGAPANCRTRSDGGVGTNVHVVANLNQVVQLDSILDDRVLQSTTVNRRVRAYLHIVTDPYATELGNLYPDSVVIGDAESVGTNDHARMDDCPSPDVHASTQDDSRRNSPMRTN